MEILDSEGRLFGVVNIIDAFVVFIILAVVISGITFVFGSGEQEQEQALGTAYVTLDLGEQSASEALAINLNDTYSPSTDTKLTITDIYRIPQGSGTRAVVRVALRGPLADGSDTITYNGNPPRIGRELTISTGEYKMSGQIIARGTSPSLNFTDSHILLTTTLPVEDASQISTGDTYTIAGREVGTVESVSIYPTDTPEQVRAVVGITLQTIRLGGSSQFGGTRLDTGATIPVRTPEYAFAGEIVRLDTTKERGVERTRTVTLTLEDVPADKVDRIRKGQIDRLVNTTFARLVKVEQEPSQFVATTDRGEAVLTDHPVNKDLTITAELTVRETATSVQFKGRPIQPGSTITLSLNKTTIQPQVHSL